MVVNQMIFSFPLYFYFIFMTSFYDRPRKFHPGQHGKFTPLLKKERSERTFNRICEDHLTCDRKCSKIYPSGTLFYAMCTPAI